MTTLSSLDPGRHRLTCPACGRRPSDKTFGVTADYDGSAVGHCFRCEYVETYRPERSPKHRPGGAIRRPVVRNRHETLSDYGIDLFKSCTGVRGTVGERYLEARGCELPPEDGDLRYHPALRHPPSDYTGPALVALVTHAETKAPLTLHRTWIRPDGRKADCNPPRMLLGNHPKKFGVVRLWPDECVTYGLAVAEGIETALSLAVAFKPVWSCIDAGNLKVLPVLKGVENLVIGADHDEAGIKAAVACADRWAMGGADVRVIAPMVPRQDWNDVEGRAA